MYHFVGHQTQQLTKFIGIATGDESSIASSSSDTDTELLEINSRAQLNRAVGFMYCPEKLGELAVYMMTKIYCKLIEDLKSGKNVQSAYEVCGLLLERPNLEAIQCKMIITTVAITSGYRGALP